MKYLSRILFDPTVQIMIAKAMYYQKEYDGASKILRQLLPKLKNISYKNYARLTIVRYISDKWEL